MNNELSSSGSQEAAKQDQESIDNENWNTSPEAGAKTSHASWRKSFRMAFDRASKQHKLRETRQELRRDRTKTLVTLLAVVIVLLLFFFVLFSSPTKATHLLGENPHRQPSLGQKITPGQYTNNPAALAPMLSAEVRANHPTTQGQVTAEDISRTSRTGHYTKPSPATKNFSETRAYALGQVDFSDPLARTSTSTQAGPPPSPLPSSAEQGDLKKPSLVFVISTTEGKTARQFIPEAEDETLTLPAGTRLLARLQAPVSSAVAPPVVAVVEYNYERDGQIVIPAGAKVLGRLTHASPSGDVAIQFSRVEMLDGTWEKLDALAMDLRFRPLKGYVSGKKTGTRFLVRSLTGLGTIASYLVGPQASGSAGLLSTNVLMRERLADNIASAGQEELNGLAFADTPVVTVPGNTRFYVVLEKPVSEHPGPGRLPGVIGPKSDGTQGGVPTLEELRQLIQLRREIADLYTQNSVQPTLQGTQQR